MPCRHYTHGLVLLQSPTLNMEGHPSEHSGEIFCFSFPFLVPAFLPPLWHFLSISCPPSFPFPSLLLPLSIPALALPVCCSLPFPLTPCAQRSCWFPLSISCSVRWPSATEKETLALFSPLLPKGPLCQERLISPHGFMLSPHHFHSKPIAHCGVPGPTPLAHHKDSQAVARKGLFLSF